VKQRSVIDMAADRGPFICQSQSLNLHVAEPTTGKVSVLLFTVTLYANLAHNLTRPPEHL